MSIDNFHAWNLSLSGVGIITNGLHVLWIFCFIELCYTSEVSETEDQIDR